MRVIAGSAKGRPLIVPKGQAVRPTSDKVKGAIFSMLESLLVSLVPDEEELSPFEVWPGLVMLDLYSGTGALAIEALSRGAEWVDMVEGNAEACRVIRSNVAATGFQNRSRLLCMPVQNALAGDSRHLRPDGYDIIALDPPYADTATEQVMLRLATSAATRPGSVVVLEHSRRVSFAEAYGGLIRVKEKRHGDTVVALYLNEEDTP